MKRTKTRTKTLKPDNCIGEVVFNTWDCYILLDTYKVDSSYCIRLIDATDSLPICTATVLLPYIYDSRSAHLRREDVAIKDYSENMGILDCLIDAGIISPPIYFRGEIPVCKIIVPIPTAIPKKELTLEPKTISENQPRKERRKSLNPHSVWKG